MVQDINYPYMSNLNIHPALAGMEYTHSSFACNNSAPRADMWSSHIKQALVIDGSEFKRIFTGFEHNLGEYEFSRTRRKQDAQILAVIPKYAHRVGKYRVVNNPSLTVVWLGVDDHMIYYSTVENYTRGSDGFGYENVWTPMVNRLSADQYLGKDDVLVTSPNHKDGAYCYGVNANVAYMTSDDTIEDAMGISRSLADKMRSTEIRRTVITLSENKLPINIYGNEIEYKFLPDIGDYVGNDGILCAFRPVSSESFIVDSMSNELNKVHKLHDEVYYVEPGTKILDLDFFVSRINDMPKTIFEQVEKYNDGIIEYYKRVVEVYRKNRALYKISPEFNTLVTNSMARLTAAGVRGVDGVPVQSRARLLNRHNKPIEYLQVAITHMHKRELNLGFKITDTHGCKGVVCKIIPDEDMPVDKEGFRADIIINTASVIARMNFGQCYEQVINRCSEFVRRKLADIYLTDQMGAFNVLIDYYNDINPNYAELVKRVKDTDASRIDHVKKAIDKGIYLNIPPSLNTIDLDLLRKLRTKWNVTVSPVTFTKRDNDGNIINTFTTVADVCIGSKYLVLLGKIPEAASSGVAHVNQFNTPMKSSSRDMYPIRANPVRFGEDEVRIIAMDLEDPNEHMRLTCLQANSPTGVDATVNELLTNPHPTQIKRINISNEELIRSNTINGIFWHMMSCIGVDSHTKTNEQIPSRPKISDHMPKVEG